MADILIRGMEMPRTCIECKLRHKTMCLPLCQSFVLRNHKADAGRMQNCPLIPLPEWHGRLIDANKLIKAMFTASDGTIMRDTNIDGWPFEMRYKDIKRYIKTAPTIVPAEGGNAGG